MSKPLRTLEEALKERRRYAEAWNKTMELMWREQITLLNAIDTGALLRSIGDGAWKHDETYSELEFRESFLEYGVYVERGTGSTTPIGNLGDLHHNNNRKPKPWISKKWWYSGQRLKEFFADNMGSQFIGIMQKTME